MTEADFHMPSYIFKAFKVKFKGKSDCTQYVPTGPLNNTFALAATKVATAEKSFATLLFPASTAQ